LISRKSDPVLRNYSDLYLLGRLVRQSKPYWPHISAILILRIFAVPLALLIPVPLKIVVDSVVGTNPVPQFITFWAPDIWINSDLAILTFAALMQVSIVLITQCQELGSYVLRASAGQGLLKEFRTRLFSHLQRLSLRYHDTQGTAESVYRVQMDAPAIRDIAINNVIPTLGSSLTLMAMVFIIVSIDWQLAAVALAVSPVLFVLARSYTTRMRPRYREARRLEGFSIEIIQQALAAFRVVKAFGREKGEQDRFEEQADNVVRKRLWLGWAEGIFGLMVNFTIAVGSALVLYVGIRNVLNGQLTLGELLVVLAYIAQLYEPLRTISRQASSLQSSLVSAERVFEVLDKIPDVVDKDSSIRLKNVGGSVEFRNVSFSHVGRGQVLDDICFKVPFGTKLGLSGRTGAGKTTVASLLPRFYDPDKGVVLIDGIDIREYSLADLRSHFAIVLQEPVLFSSSISENIAYGRPNASRREIELAASAANIIGFIEELPDGFETLVGERGMKLSGGERQRIALARAFLKDAPILILDEPTSSVDTETEVGIMETMERLMADRTTFMIAHRVSTLDICDARLEIENGIVTSATGSVEI